MMLMTEQDQLSKHIAKGSDKLKGLKLYQRSDEVVGLIPTLCLTIVLPTAATRGLWHLDQKG